MTIESPRKRHERVRGGILKQLRPANLALLRFMSDSRGLAAIEFAFIVPIMLLLLVGTVELSQALTVDRRVTRIASSTADLISRNKAISTEEVAGIMQIVAHLMRPYNPSPLRITLLNVIADADDQGDTTVCWSYEHNGGSGSYAEGASYPLPDDLVDPGSSVIVAEVSYDYQPLIFDTFIKMAFSLKDTLYLKPRMSSYVEYNGNPCF